MMRNCTLLSLFFFIFILYSCFCFAEDKEKAEIFADRIEMRKTENIAIFTGNVKYIKSTQTLYADKITEYKAQKEIFSENNVHGIYKTKEGELIDVYCDYNRYNENSGISEFWNKDRQPYIIYTSTSVSQTKVYADRIRIEEKEENIVFTGNVAVFQESNTAKSNYAKYIHSKEMIYLSTGTVTYLGEEFDTEFVANIINFYLAEKKLLMEENVHGYIINRKQS